GGQMSIAVDPQGRPSIAYRDFVNYDLMFATLINGNWVRVTVDSAGEVGDYPTLGYGTNGRAYISYYDKTNGDLKLAWQAASGKFVNTAIETSGDVGAFTSMVVEPNTGLLHIAYADNTGFRLKYAAQRPDGSFAIRAIDRGTPSGVRHASMTFDTAGRPWIAYYDVAKKDLRVSTTADGVSWSSQRVASGGNQGEFANIFLDGEVVTVLYLNRTLKTVNTAAFKSGGWKFMLRAMGSENIASAVSSAGEFIFSATSMYDGKLRTLTDKFDHQYANPLDPGERIMAWEVIGHSSSDPSVRYIGWGIPQHGWQYYVNGRFAQLRSLGLKRIFLHNPFGNSVGETHFQFDQYIHSQEAGLTMVTDTFVSAWKPVIDSGVEVIAYLGSIPYDPQFTTITDFDHYMDRIKRSIEPLLQAGASIGFDSIVHAQAHWREWHVVAALRNSGVKVYAENRPPRDYTHWHDVNGVYIHHGWITSDPANNPLQHWAAPNHMLRGEILRGAFDPPDGVPPSSTGWLLPIVLGVLRDGHTPATDIVRLASEGYSLPQIMALAFPSGGRGSVISGAKTESSPVKNPFGKRPLIEREDLLS
ncbi:MAG: hypothetical protein NZ561_05875, partial [Phycisphaerae bacterium]|nr:hypothetical protein [Phycisphaerae bacterium]